MNDTYFLIFVLFNYSQNFEFHVYYIISYVVHLLFLYFISYRRRGKRKTIKEGAFNISHRMSHPHGASSFGNIDRQGPSFVQSVTADTSPHMALNIESETSGHAAQENQNQTYESKCSLFISCPCAVAQSK